MSKLIKNQSIFSEYRSKYEYLKYKYRFKQISYLIYTRESHNPHLKKFKS